MQSALTAGCRLDVRRAIRDRQQVNAGRGRGGTYFSGDAH
jgi:hypothetical protein